MIFSANQGEAQITGPYPPFGLAIITVFIAAFLMLVGIYNSAVLVSANNDLRQSIYKYELGSKLLGQIGRADVKIELRKAVTKIPDEKKHLMATDRRRAYRIGLKGIKEISRVCNTRSEKG